MSTLVIASAASGTGAIVTSRVWGPGTIITAALTPVIVAFGTEALRKPTDRLAERVTSVRRLPGEPAGPGAPPVPETAAEARVERAAQGGLEEELERERTAQYRTYAPPPERTARRRLPVAIAVVTGLLAFAVAAAALTLPELVAGDSVTGDGRTTLFGGKDRDRDAPDREQPAPTTQPPPGPTTRPEEETLTQPEETPTEPPPETTTETQPQTAPQDQPQP